jgi:hypothetical protein
MIEQIIKIKNTPYIQVNVYLTIFLNFLVFGKNNLRLLSVFFLIATVSKRFIINYSLI